MRKPAPARDEADASGGAGRLTLALFLLSAALIAFQVVLMQALAQAQGHHLAFAVISLALLGFGSSGTVLSLARSALLPRVPQLLPTLLFLTALSCAWALPWGVRIGATIELPLLWAEARAWWPLLAASALVFIPFFLGALFLGLVFTRDVDRIGARYAANLLGSASGGGWGLLVLYALPPERAWPLLALPLLVAAWLLMPRRRDPARAWPGLALAGLASVVAVASVFRDRPPPLSPYKALPYSLQLPEARVAADRPHPQGRLQWVESPALRYGPGLSLRFRGEIPALPHLYSNGDSYGVLPGASAGALGPLLDASVQGLPLALRAPHRALVLQPGAGVMTDYLLARAVPAITVVEPHPVAARWLRAAFAPAVAAGQVSIDQAAARAWMNGTTGTFDLILLPAQGSFGGGLGLRALQEDYLLTVEALRQALRLLSPEGLLAVSLWLEQPPRQTLKLLATLDAAHRAEGRGALAETLVAVRSWEMITLVVGARPWTEAERAQVAAFAERGDFDQAWIPGVGWPEQSGVHDLEGDRWREGFTAILSGQGRAFQREYPFALAPPRDDRPYFHQLVRWSRLSEVTKIFGEQALIHVEMGSVLVAMTTALLAVAAGLLILAPLLGRGWSGGGRGAVLLYFAAIGLGFMFLEIVWIQRFTLYWGHPLYSVAGVMTALLGGMGLGSVASARLVKRPRALRRVLLGLVALIALSLPAFSGVFQATLDWPGWAKGAVGVGLLALPAIGLGLPFPLALRLLGAHQPASVPWAWAINGCFSVLAAPLAALLALQFGFTAVGLLAAGAYLLAAVVIGRLYRAPVH